MAFAGKATGETNGPTMLASTMSYKSMLQLTSTAGPNGETATISYDTQQWPATTTAPTGAATTYTYNDSAMAPSVTATVNGRYTKTCLDGLGRTIQVEKGTGDFATLIGPTSMA